MHKNSTIYAAAIAMALSTSTAMADNVDLSPAQRAANIKEYNKRKAQGIVDMPRGATIVGRRIPAFCSSGGRAMLSRLPEAEARALVEYSPRTPLTPYTITDVEAIMVEIARARRDGFAICAQEALTGEIVVAAPIVDLNGLPRGAVHIAMSIADHDQDEVRARFAPMAVATARLIAGGGY